MCILEFESRDGDKILVLSLVKEQLVMYSDFEHPKRRSHITDPSTYPKRSSTSPLFPSNIPNEVCKGRRSDWSGSVGGDAKRKTASYQIVSVE